MKKIVSAVAALSIAASLLPIAAKSAIAADTSVTELTNVAKFKPVTSSHLLTSDPYKVGIPTQLVDDHNNTEFIINWSNGEQWMCVDLQRRYKIDYIELSSRVTDANAIWLSDFEIQASNDEGFKTYKVLDKMESAKGEKLKIGKNATDSFDGSGSEAFRYVRIYAKHMLGFSELRVYAKQTATEIKPQSVDGGSYHDNHWSTAYNKAIDNDLSTRWVSKYGQTDNNNFLTIDFGEAKRVGKIELEARRDSTEINPRKTFSLYGSNKVMDNEENMKLSEIADKGYTKLAYLKYPEGEGYKHPYPSKGKYITTVDETAEYRYITYKKNESADGALAEIKAYEINPVVNLVCATQNGIKVEFSDEMNEESVKGAISLIDVTDGEEKIIDVNKADDYTFEIVPENFDKSHKYTIRINGAENLYGTVSKAYEKTFLNFSGLSSEKINLTNENSEEIANYFKAEKIKASAIVQNSGDEAKDAILTVAFYNGTTLAGVKTGKVNVPAGEDGEVSFEITVPTEAEEGYNLKAFLWDISADNIKPITEARSFIQGIRTKIYVSPTGSDSASGENGDEYQTIERAMAEVKKYNSDMNEDINVYLKPGVYELSNTLSFSTEDGGSNGYSVNYVADGGEAVISGGSKISNWQSISGNLYKAENLNFDIIRELYTDGRIAKRAAASSKIKGQGFYTVDGETKGILVNSSDIPSTIKNVFDVQLVFARGWKTYICNVDDIIDAGDGKKALLMSGKSFAGALNGSHAIKGESTFYFENVYEFLDEAGEFYYDKGTKTLYLMTDGTNPNHMEIYAPRLETLLDITGESNGNKAENISFSGLNFAHSTWRYTEEKGFLGIQAQSFVGDEKNHAEDILDKSIVGAAVKLSKAKNITFTDNVFSGISKVGVGLYNGAEDCRIEGNVFYDLGDSAVTVGLPTDNYMEKDYEGYNLAYNKPCTAKSTNSTYPEFLAVDGNSATGWVCNGVDGDYSKNWWQVDLGAEYEIDRIEVDARKDANQETTRRYFEILASNDPEFSDYVKLAEIMQEEPSFGHQGMLTRDISDTGKYRYVRVIKTNNEYFYLAEIRILNLSMEHIPHKQVCTNNVIKNNYITEIGLSNFGAPGMQVYYADETEISNNCIKNVPYTGIALGWGWSDYLDSETSKNNKITNNIIDNFGLINMDGAGVYTLASQPGTVISGNYIKNQNNIYGAVYPDQGSANYEICNNVLENVWLNFFLISNDRKNIKAYNNYSTTTVKNVSNKNTDCIIDDVILFIPGNMPEEAKKIADNAGLESAYKYLYTKCNLSEPVYDASEIFDNVSNELSTYVTDKQFIKYHLTDVITAAECMIELDNNTISSDLLKKLKDAKTSATTCKTLENAKLLLQSDTTVGKIDRGAVIQARETLVNAIKEITNSFN